MEKRAFLALILCLLVFLAFGYLREHFQPTPPVSPPPEAEPPPKVPAPTAKPVPMPGIPPVPATPSGQPPQDVVVETPLYRAVFTEYGACLKSFKLKKYREQLPFKTVADLGLGPFSLEIQQYQEVSKSPPAPKELVEVTSPANLPLAVTWEGETSRAAATVPYTASQKSLRLESGEEKTLTFTHVCPGGPALMKTLTFRGDTYRIDLQVMVKNHGHQPARGQVNFSLTANYAGKKPSRFGFLGFVGSINDSREEIKSTKVEELKTFTGQIDWASLEDGYFMEAMVPRAKTKSILTLREPTPGLMTVTLKTPLDPIPPGQAKAVPYALYFGPKELKTLEAADLGLEEAIDFGWFHFLALPLLYVLNFFYRYLHNYGLAIIALTILIRVLFLYPNHKSYKSMQAMQKLQPKIAKLREKYKNNREEMNRELMALYRTYKVNPASGCLPMLLQLPVFIALYNILGYALEMRHAPFIPTLPFTDIVWLADLSAKDPLLITPLIMGATMFIQQKMTPSPGDPTQAKLMLIMPVVFTFLFLNFASGLVVYWLVNNVLSIGQQYFTNKYLI